MSNTTVRSTKLPLAIRNRAVAAGKEAKAVRLAEGGTSVEGAVACGGQL